MTLLAFNRFANVFIIPFCLFPILYVRWEYKLLMLLFSVAIALLCWGMIHIYSQDHVLRPMPYKQAQVYKTALVYMFNVDARPYTDGRRVNDRFEDEYVAYHATFSKRSGHFRWFKVAKLPLLWFGLLLLPVIDAVKYRRLSVNSCVILCLFLAGYVQCVVNTLYDVSQQGHTEVWRHLSIVDALFVFALTSGIGWLWKINKRYSGVR